MKGDKPPSYSFSEYVAAIVVMLLGTGLGLFTYYIYKAHKLGPAILFGGLDLILLSGIFDPINALWLLLPFTGRPLVQRPYSLEHKIMRRAGFVAVIAGIAYWYNGPAWISTLKHALISARIHL